jgi:FMN phosphatase YigB (HAD superfamily)
MVDIFSRRLLHFEYARRSFMIEKRLQGDYQHVHFDSSGENLCIGAGDMGMRLNILLNRLHHHPNAIPESECEIF